MGMENNATMLKYKACIWQFQLHEQSFYFNFSTGIKVWETADYVIEKGVMLKEIYLARDST